MIICLNPNCPQPENPDGTNFCLSCGTGLITLLRDRYRIISLLGSGGFGRTFLAEDTDMPSARRCVIKQLKPIAYNPQTYQLVQERFQREAAVLEQLGEDNSNIPSLYAYFSLNNLFYLVQQWIKGETITQKVTVQGRLSEAESREILVNVLEVLDYVHTKGIIHRDIKPDNIIIRERDNKPVLIDFGAVRETMGTVVNSQGVQTSSIVIGTPGFMPSEQGVGKPVYSSDLYSLGLTIIYGLTGKIPQELPLDHETGNCIWYQYANDVSPELAAILDKVIEFHPRDRYPRAKDMLNALNASGGAISATALVTSVTPPTPPPPLIPSNPPQPVPQPPPVAPIKPSSAPIWSRRKTLTTLTFAGIGMGGAIVWQAVKQTSKQPISKQPTFNLQSFNFGVVSVNDRGEIINHHSSQAKYFAEDLGNGITLEMVAIPGGTFLMGSKSTELKRYQDESPQHQVTVASFYMGKFAVTQAQWRAVAALPPVKGSLNPNPSGFKGNNRPVEKVSWNDAVEFCDRLAKKTKHNYRLPSEAEWEYACRAGTTTPFYFGETITTELANYIGDYRYASAPEGIYRGQTTDIGSFPPNSFGLYDMHGNLWEWCTDLWHDNYAGSPNDGSIWQKGGNNSLRLIRGGSWNNSPVLCRSAIRNRYQPDASSNSVGFRVVVGS